MIKNLKRDLVFALCALALANGPLTAMGDELLGTSRVVFVQKKAEKFGNFEPRPNAIFQAGEEILLYAEPTGFVVPADNRAKKIDMSMDIKVSTSDGRVLLEKSNLMTLRQTSETEIKVFLNMAVNVRTPGSYSFAFRLNDNFTGRYLDYSVPFVVQEKLATSAQ
jgi:hypothetical protein